MRFLPGAYHLNAGLYDSQDQVMAWAFRHVHLDGRPADGDASISTAWRSAIVALIGPTRLRGPDAAGRQPARSPAASREPIRTAAYAYRTTSRLPGIISGTVRDQQRISPSPGCCVVVSGRRPRLRQHHRRRRALSPSRCLPAGSYTIHAIAPADANCTVCRRIRSRHQDRTAVQTALSTAPIGQWR